MLPDKNKKSESHSGSHINYRVQDLILAPDAVKVIFLLESPHFTEVVHGHPAAGDTGISIMNFLCKEIKDIFAEWESDVPIGCQIITRNESRIGLMNCSLLPMNKNVYCLDYYNRNETEIRVLDLIRNNPKSKKRTEIENEACENDIRILLKRRLKRLKSSNCLVIPCGVLACKLLNQVSYNNIYSKDVPHPSRKRWNNTDNFEDVIDFINMIRFYLKQ